MARWDQWTRILEGDCCMLKASVYVDSCRFVTAHVTEAIAQ